MSEKETAQEIALAALTIRGGLDAVARSVAGIYQTETGEPSVLVLALLRAVEIVCDEIRSSRSN